MPQRRNHLIRLQANLQRRLNKLEERRALLGLDAPAALLLEIEDVQAELAQYRQELAELPAGPLPSETDPPTLLTTRSARLAAPTSPYHLFICYKRHIRPDQRLAAYLHNYLRARGHAVFFDRKLQSGQNWLEEIDRQIKASDFMVVLLSEEAARSEMVQAEVRRAFEYRRLYGRPQILPVRMAFEGLLPYAIDVFLDPLQYVIWRSEADNEAIGQEILAAVGGQFPARAPVGAGRPVGADSIISEDGYPVPDDSLHPPLPEFDPRFLETLEAPGGVVKLRDTFYIERTVDAQFRREVARPGTTTTIRAPRQIGKSSLLVRGIYYARQRGARVVNLDLQRVNSERLARPELFLRDLAEFIVHKLGLDPAEVARVWQESAGPQYKLTLLLEEYILPASPTPVVLALDEVDTLLQTDYHGDFFGMLRSWHNSAAFDTSWEKLSLALVISTEPYLLISAANQSPFNVGLKLYLQDFNQAQVQDLNRRHGSPVPEQDFPELMELLNGHPYLTRKALYTLVTEQLNWQELTRAAAADDGPFHDHLRRQQWLLRDSPDLWDAVKEIIKTGRCADETSVYRLLRAGLIRQDQAGWTFRCGLYRVYFQEKLGC